MSGLACPNRRRLPNYRRVNHRRQSVRKLSTVVDRLGGGESAGRGAVRPTAIPRRPLRLRPPAREGGARPKDGRRRGAHRGVGPSVCHPWAERVKNS